MSAAPLRRRAAAALLAAAAAVAPAAAQPPSAPPSAAAPPVLETGGARPMPADWVDRATGHRVRRLTLRGGRNTNFYFTQDPFVPAAAGAAGGAGALMVYHGSTPAGRQLFAVDLATRASRQLTDRPGGVSGEIVSPGRREAFFNHRDSVFAVSVDTRATRLVAVLPAELRGGGVTTLNADGTLLGGVVGGAEARAIFARYPKKADFFPRIFAAHVPHVLFTVDVRTGAARVVHQERTWLGHVQFSPTDPALLMFCHEGPWHLVDRIWTVDLRTGQVRRRHERTVANEIAGHEFWSPDGRRIWYDLQVPRSVTFFVAGTDVATGAATRWALGRDEWSIHFTVSPDQTLFAGDGGDSTQVARARDGRWIYLFRPQGGPQAGAGGGRFAAERLVDMRRHDYRALEPNVHFSPDGRWVVFGGNFEGDDQVYAVEVARAGAGGATGPGDGRAP